MGVALRFVILGALRVITIARNPDHDKLGGVALRALEPDGTDRHCLGTVPRTEISPMTQTSNRFFDEIGRLMNDAAGAAQGVKREFDTMWRAQAEKFLREMDLVKREEFEAVKDMARLAREENEALKARLAAVEAKLGVSPNTGS
jgi:BMFP domain-containing protein YqiC